MAKAIGPHFAAKLEAAGLGGLPFSWTEDGQFTGLVDLSPAQRSALAAVVAAHAPEKIDLVAFAADLRWKREVGGIMIAGMPIATDDRSKLMILGARVKAVADAEWSTLWDGEHVIDALTMIAISDAVEAHVNAGFARFGEVKTAILAGTLTTREAVTAAMAA